MEDWDVGEDLKDSVRDSVWESVEGPMKGSLTMRTSVFYLVLNSVWRFLDIIVVGQVRRPTHNSIER